MDDEDWLDDSNSSLQQGHQADPLVDREWEKLSTKYSDVRCPATLPLAPS